MTAQLPPLRSRYPPSGALSWGPRVSGVVCPSSVPEDLSKPFPTHSPVCRGRSSLCTNITPARLRPEPKPHAWGEMPKIQPAVSQTSAESPLRTQTLGRGI